eukprot:gnl/TRDRNA2_/TRDRNA2_147388_c1_seq1.p1 gnl/TRDRNA2_/TRDRNA2_147388_c1~~gnl/TRDRNA2_/TRDRNA2_147388_c1_seq1.p1  ORF type:complete len:560 (-),score=72.44 gnl/TRDRNA2_/TRDRNA2_147388_c1_seq1:32-1678(-)
MCDDTVGHRCKFWAVDEEEADLLAMVTCRIGEARNIPWRAVRNMIAMEQVLPGAFAAWSGLEGDCEIGYVGSTAEDVVLKVFIGHSRENFQEYKYVGLIHAMQPGNRSVKVRSVGAPYYLGLQVHRDLNADKFGQMPVNEQKALVCSAFCTSICMNRALEARAQDADFLVNFAAPDVDANNTLLKHIENEGIKSGPWASGPWAALNPNVKMWRVALCNDLSIGLGVHVEDRVALVLGSCSFGGSAPRAMWFDEFRRAAAGTKYGFLTLNPSPECFFSPKHQREFHAINGYGDNERIEHYVYVHSERRIVTRDEYWWHLLSAGPALAQARCLNGRLGGHILLALCAPDTIGYASDEGQTLLHLAATKAHKEAVTELLTAHAEVQSRTLRGNTPLHNAATRGCDSVIAQLVDARASVNAHNVVGATPLHAAAIAGHEAATLLLLQSGASFKSECASGSTPLHFAAASGQKGVASRLLDAHADPGNRNGLGASPLHLAAHHGREAVVAKLMAAGADVEVTDERGLTARDHAEQQGHAGVVRLLCSSKRSLK